MNASYKIVLLGAFVLFAAVIGYYVLNPGDGDKPGQTLASSTDQQDADDQTPGPSSVEPDEGERETTPGRPSLDRPLPGRTPEVTIGAREPGEIEDPRTTPGGGGEERAGPGGEPDETLALGNPERTAIGGPGGLERPGPGSTESTNGEGSGTEEVERPGPGTTETETTEVTETVEEPGETEPAETEPDTTTSRPAGDTPRTYTVKPGDTFASIALAVYGEESAWFQIAQANPSVDPKRLQVDQVIVLPNLADTERERDEPIPPAPGQDQTYTIQPGDNLSRIAKRFYGDTEMWDLIYNRNRDKIGPRPDRLKVGMELIIPQPYNGAE